MLGWEVNSLFQSSPRPTGTNSPPEGKEKKNGLGLEGGFFSHWTIYRTEATQMPSKCRPRTTPNSPPRGLRTVRVAEGVR